MYPLVSMHRDQLAWLLHVHTDISVQGTVGHQGSDIVVPRREKGF